VDPLRSARRWDNRLKAQISAGKPQLTRNALIRRGDGSIFAEISPAGMMQ